MTRARIVWVTEEAPDRALGGGNIRQAHLFTALAARIATDLVVTAPVRDPVVREHAGVVTELAAVQPARAVGSVGRRVQDLANLLVMPDPAAMRPAAGNRQRLAAAISGGAYELACVEHEALAPLAWRAGALRGVLTLHHLLSTMIEEEHDLAPGRRQRWYRSRDLLKARRVEREALRSYDRCIVCSQEDRDRLAAGTATDAHIEVVPNGVDLDAIRPTRLPGSLTVLLPGTLSWPPNVDGAHWLSTAIWPRVRAAIPTAELTIVGRAPAPEVARLAALDGVSVYADVPAMAPYFQAAQVVAVPVRVGTGTRLKALEAMAAGRPVVGTRIGLEGLGVSDGVQARVADDPACFADALVELLSEPHTAGRLADAGRALVQARFGWERVGARFTELIGGMLDQPVSQRASSKSA